MGDTDQHHRRQRGEETRPWWCICDDAFWLRGRDDPRCRHDEIEEREKMIASLQKVVSVVADAFSVVDETRYPAVGRLRDDAQEVLAERCASCAVPWNRWADAVCTSTQGHHTFDGVVRRVQ